MPFAVNSAPQFNGELLCRELFFFSFSMDTCFPGVLMKHFRNLSLTNCLYRYIQKNSQLAERWTINEPFAGGTNVVRNEFWILRRERTQLRRRKEDDLADQENSIYMPRYCPYCTPCAYCAYENNLHVICATVFHAIYSPLYFPLTSHESTFPILRLRGRGD